MTEKEKGLLGLLYNPNKDEALQKELACTKEMCTKYNQLSPLQEKQRDSMIRTIIGALGSNAMIVSPFWCDYGSNISIGDSFYSNHNLVILDGGKISFGDNVFVGPNCCFSTAGHPIDVPRRNEGLEFARAITVGNNVWFGAGVTVLPGVTIGDNSVIGAGSLVNKDLPSGVIAVGNPCKVLREITPQDSERF